MQKYPAVIGMLVTSVCLWMGTATAARLPEGLPNLLKTHNFNIYPAPCQANNMILRDLAGRVVDLNALRGKVVILNFWKIDCQPCTAEKPILERLHRKYAQRGLEIIAVNLFDEHGKVKSYAQRSGFGFRFCCDPENRFSVQKQNLGGGTPSTFIVNSKSEAIYEVPGVPTTYLIDRTGQVIGNGVGMVDWEEEPFTALLESLLGPPRQLVAQHSETFSDIAGQGPVANPGSRPAGPRRTSDAPPTAPDQQPPARPSLPGGPGASELHEVSPSQPPSDSSTSKEPAPAPKEATTKQRRVGTGVQQSAKPKPRAKRQPAKNTLNASPEYGKPKPFRSPIQATGSAAEPEPPSRHVTQASPGSPLPTPYVPPQTGAPASALPPGQSTRSPLPAAMPYTPPNLSQDRRPAPRPVVPDENGQITARIPAGSAPATEEEGKSPSQAGSRGWPVARPRVPSNPIDTFILDSFEKQASPGQAPPQALYPQPDQDQNQRRTQYQPQQKEPVPASSVFGQLTRDVQNLGEGIRQTFSGWWPGR